MGGVPPDDSEDDGDDENDVARATPIKRKKRCENHAKRCENGPKRAENDSKTTRKQPKTIRKTYGKLAVLNVSRLRKSTITPKKEVRKLFEKKYYFSLKKGSQPKNRFF